MDTSQNIKAQKRILIMDACNSGQAINDIAGNKDLMAVRNTVAGDEKKEIERLNDQAGMFIPSARLYRRRKRYCPPISGFTLILSQNLENLSLFFLQGGRETYHLISFKPIFHPDPIQPLEVFYIICNQNKFVINSSYAD